MEHINNPRLAEATIADGWAAWDAVPRDGPAIFVIDIDAYDNQGRIRGRWISLGPSRESGRAALAALFGREPRQSEWAIVDQVGLGDLMVPDDLVPDELTVLPAMMPGAQRTYDERAEAPEADSHG